MTATTTRHYEDRARIIRAMASPKRLMLVDELARDDQRCVCELAALIDADISTVSRHLTMLRQAGIIDEQRRGKMVYYHIRNPLAKRFLEFAECCLRRAAEE